MLHSMEKFWNVVDISLFESCFVLAALFVLEEFHNVASSLEVFVLQVTLHSMNGEVNVVGVFVCKLLRPGDVVFPARVLRRDIIA